MGQNRELDTVINIPLFQSVITRHEGVRYQAYRDTNGNVTVGIGTNLDAPGAEALCQESGVPYAATYEGNPITGAQVQSLFQITLSQAIRNAQIAVKNFEDLPDNAQAVVVDCVFNMGLSKFLGFQKTIAALEEEDWTTAAAELKNSLWCSEVGTRCADDCQLLLACENQAK